MNDEMLRAYVAEVIMQEFKKNHACAQQLFPRGETKGVVKRPGDKEEEVEEMSVAGSIAGFMAPLGYSSEDAKGPGVPRSKKKRGDFVRWK